MRREKVENSSDTEVLKEYTTADGKRRKLVRQRSAHVAIDTMPDRVGDYESTEEYEEIRPGVWQKVPGSEKYLRKVEEKNNG